MPDTADSPESRATHLIHDLQWAVNSREPCRRADQRLWRDNSDWFREWIATGAGLSADRAQHLWHLRQGRLGHYFEGLWQHYIEASPDWVPLLSHWPIRAPLSSEKGQRTLGEIDLIIANDTDVVHLELAVKFYLRLNRLPDIRTESTAPVDDQWVGPGLADTLGRKLRHVRQRQLPLSHHPDVRARLPRAITHRQFLMKGRFFEPADPAQPEAIPQWLTAAQWRQSEMMGTGTIHRVHRGDWLTASAGGVDCTEELAGPHWVPERPMLSLWRRAPSSEPVWRMIVPDTWPERAQRFLSEVVRHG